MLLRTLAITLILLTSSYAEPAPDSEAPVISNPTWVERPTGADFARNYPPNALAQGIHGRVVLDCLVAEDSGLSCSVASETPEGWRFGPAAIAISRSFRLQPRMENGVPTAGGRVRIPITFATQSDGERPPDALDIPTWSDAPSLPAIIAATPPGAVGVRGRGVLSCRANEDRTLACEQILEAPAGLGFGEAALALSQRFVISDHETDFIARHREEPFLLPINFGAQEVNEPVSLGYLGVGPVEQTLPPEAIQTIYPSRARAGRIEGDVSMLCTLRSMMSPHCVLQRETPTGWNFGDVVLAVAQTTGPTAEEADSVPGDQILTHWEFRLAD